MKKFLIYVSLFSLLVLLTLGIGEAILRNTPNSYSIKNDYVEKNGQEIKTLILGSSYTYFGVIADSLGPEYLNMANILQNFEYDYRLLNHYSDRLPDLEKIILPVSYFSFFSPPFEKSGDKSNKWLEIYYRIYMGIDKYPKLSRYNLELSNMASYKEKLKNRLLGNDQISSPQGFGLYFTLSNRTPDWKQTAEEHALYHTAEDFSYIGYNLMWLDSICTFCKKNNIDLLLITTPVITEYIKRLDKRQYEMMKSLTDSIINRYDLSYTDFSTDSRFTDEDFYDADHLSDPGAIKFTRILKDSLF